MTAAATPLSDKQRRYLRGLGHALKPIIQIGHAGASAAVIAETVRALADHELIKVRAAGLEREARDAALDALAAGTQSEIVGRIGHTAVLFRRNAQKPRVVMPD